MKDSTSGAHHGGLIGDARIVAAQLPASFLMRPSSKCPGSARRRKHVELPPRLFFTNQVVTVEGWVKWRELGVYSRFFQFADAALQIGVMNFANRPPPF